MPLEMSVADLTRDLVNCVVMHKNKPVKVQMIAGDGKVHFLDLLSQKKGSAPFTLKAFAAPLRVGFVNFFGGCYYVARMPVRRYYMGLHRQNFQIKALPCDYMPGVQDKISGLDSVELAQAMMGQYPTLLEALTEAKLTASCCAFDKQFAVDHKQRVFFKESIVGVVGRYVNKPKIIWAKGMEHFENLLDGNYEKALRNTWSSPR